MSTHVISQLAENLLNACCGDKADAITSKLPFQRKEDHENDLDLDVAEEKKEEVPSTPAPVASEKKTDPKTTDGEFSDFETKYELTLWKDLPEDVRNAAIEIGYNEEMWNNNEECHVGGKHWHDLSEAELKAVQTLGWEEKAWEDQYHHSEWEDLPALQLRAAEAAGYTKTSWSGPPHEKPQHLEHSHWDELDVEDQKRMAVFGYTKHEWDH
ncbi:hypothetical protein IV203_026443 [Nitzschia inconspicua]|uniref:Uncharacterized protein n=1 Tax=Nitzschia inconspicua TaxID=303405 RepID=A0A9K3LJA0_9STRA|nr:hypothetical protein IV203_026443 [Nitzschia inconspicua]